MSSNAEKFEQLLCSDEGLQAKLKAAAEAFKGDGADECEVFDALIAPLAAEAGLPFTYEDAKALAAEGTELGDEALDAVAGGGCFIVGLGEGSGACMGESFGATGCYGVGVGMFAGGDD